MSRATAFNPTISMVQSVGHKRTEDHRAQRLIAAIRHGRWKREITKIRAAFNNGEKDRALIDLLKRSLPAAMLSGTFSHRANDALVRHSGLICADLDSLGERLPDIRQRLETSPHVWAIFLSPSGDGLKALFRTTDDPARHRDSFRAIERHVHNLTGVRIDQSGKDPARLCFVSFDPDVRTFKNAIPIVPLPAKAKPRSVKGNVADLGLRQRTAVELLGVIEWTSDAHGFLPCPGKHLHTTGDGPRDCEIHLDGVPTIHCFHDHCTGIRDALNRELRSRIGKAELPASEGRSLKSFSPDDEEIIREPEDQTPEPGKFPLDELNPTIRTIVEESAETYQIDPALPAMAGVATLAGAIGKRVVVTGAASGRRTHLNAYVICGAPKSYGKNAASTMAQPLRAASNETGNKFHNIDKPKLSAERKIAEQREKFLVRQCANAKATESEREELQRIQARLGEISYLLAWPPTYIIGNSTSAAMTEMLKRNGETLFSFSPEAGELIRIALGKFTKDNAADFDLFLSGYTVESARETRIARGDSGDFVPCISVLWFCQPFLLRELFTNEEALERGLTARVLPFIVEHDQIPEDDGVLRYVSEGAQRAWDVLVRGALAIRESSREIPCSSEAREIFRSFHNEAVRLRNEQFRSIEGELGRWRENAIRIAGGQCIADALTTKLDVENLIITPEHATRGVAIARWSHLHSIAMLNRGITERHWQHVETLQTLLARYQGKVTLRDLHRRHGFAPHEVKSLAMEYPEMLLVKVVKPATGRPSEILTFTKK